MNIASKCVFITKDGACKEPNVIESIVGQITGIFIGRKQLVMYLTYHSSVSYETLIYRLVQCLRKNKLEIPATLVQLGWEFFEC